MARSGGVFQRLQIGFYSGVIDPQKLVGRSHHVDTVGLSLGAFLVHEPEDRFIQRRILQIDAHDKEQRPPQGGCANFAHGFVLASHVSRVIRRSIKAGVGNECFLGIKPAHVANFGYELRAERRPYAKHTHDDRIFWQLCG